MNDLQELWAWHEAEGCRFAEFMAGEDQWELNRVRIHRETAEILRLLDRVRSECYGAQLDELGHPVGSSVLRIKGPPDILRQLAERLKQG